MNFLGFLLARTQALWYSMVKRTPQAVSTPPAPAPAVPSVPQGLEAILDKYKELPKDQRPSPVPEKYVYLEPVVQRQVLIRRLHKLVGRYGFHLKSVEYFVQHNASEQYTEDLTLHIQRFDTTNKT